ncbi:MAG: hypothetical protein Q7U87_03640, partial [bacterium]|nr:hypothetical protein [bacterium]
IEKMSFHEVHKLLKPAFDSFKDGDIEFIEDITELRNRLVHGHTKDLAYRGKNPFNDGECLAEIYWNSWSAIKALKHFYERKIEDYQAFKKKHSDIWIP